MDFQQGLITTIHEYGLAKDPVSQLNKDLLILNRSFENVELENINNIQKIINDLKVNYENQWKKVNQINTRIKLSLTFSLNSKNLNLINNL